MCWALVRPEGESFSGSELSNNGEEPLDEHDPLCKRDLGQNRGKLFQEVKTSYQGSSSPFVDHSSERSFSIDSTRLSFSSSSCKSSI